MEKYSSDDMFIPVMPRIVDPSLQLNGKSLMKSMEITENRFKENKDSENNKIANTCPPNDHIINIPNCGEKKEIIISSKYKYYALIFVSILVFITIIYFIYKYFSKKKQEENDNSAKKKITEDKINSESEDKIKTEIEAKKYISEYIDIISDTDSEIDTIKEEKHDFENNNLEIIKEEQTNSDKQWNVGVVSFENLEMNNSSKEWDVNSTTSSKGTVIEYIEEDNINSTGGDVLFESASSEYSNDGIVEKDSDKEEDININNNNNVDNVINSDDNTDDTDSLQYFNKYK